VNHPKNIWRPSLPQWVMKEFTLQRNRQTVLGTNGTYFFGNYVIPLEASIATSISPHK
jgi:hypothetical protein